MKKIWIAVLLLAGYCCQVEAQTGLANLPKENSWYRIRVVHTNKYLGTENGSIDDSAAIVQGDRIIQRRERVPTGKWVLNYDIQTGCPKGWKIQYRNNSGKPMQLSGNGFQLVEQKYQDGGTDCAYTFLFEKVGPPNYREKARPSFYKPANIEKKKKQQ